jgi:hypothetical protein
MLPNWGIDKEEEEKHKKMSWLHGYFSKSYPLMKLIAHLASGRNYSAPTKHDAEAGWRQATQHRSEVGAIALGTELPSLIFFFAPFRWRQPTTSAPTLLVQN